MNSPFSAHIDWSTLGKNHHVILSLSFIAFGTVIALLTSLISYRLEYKHIDAEMHQRFELARENKLEMLGREIDSLERVVGALAQNPLLRSYLAAEEEVSRRKLQSLFLAFARAHQEFMQVRYLDQNGLEQVRVDRSRDGQHVSVVADQQLQDKSARYYFKEVAQLPANQFWHSDLDLNRENGLIELPPRPTFRVATPLFNNNRFAGMVIVNMEASAMLQRLAFTTDFDTFVVDRDGEVLHNPDPAQSWSRYFTDKTSFWSLNPDVAVALLADPNGRYGEFESFSISRYFNNRQQLQVIMKRKPDTVQDLQQSNLAATGVIALIVICISLPLSWLAAIFPARLQEQLRKTADILRSSNQVLDRYVMIASTDTRGNITHASQAYCRKSGFDLWELQGKYHQFQLHPDTTEEIRERLSETLKNGQTWQGELKKRTKSGQEFWVYNVSSPKHDAEGNLIGYAHIAQDITDKKAIEKLSVTDLLTQVYNRRKLDEALHAEMKRFNREEQPFSIILLDIDHFKRINDNFGHLAGDKVLKETAARMQLSLREIDCVGRWGGEEFLVVCPLTDINGAQVLAEKLRAALQSLRFANSLEVTASFGVAQSQRGEPLERLLKRVDDALYGAKALGRNRVVRAVELNDHQRA